MERKEQIEKELAELKEKLKNIEGTPAEVYTRIVGYYRPVQNWNKGKKSEYYQRKEFLSYKTEDNTHLQVEEPVAELTPLKSPEQPMCISVNDGISIREYKLFYTDSCPNCPPVKSYLTRSALEGEIVNASTKSGFDEALKYNVQATPTVIFFNKQGHVLKTAHNIDQIQQILQ